MSVRTPGDDVRQAAIDLLWQGLPAEGAFRLRVISRSMAPALQPGDIVLVYPVRAGELQTGDLVVVRTDCLDQPAGQLPLTHRLVGRDGRGWRTKGDANRTLDPPRSTAAILGRVVAVEQTGRVLDLCSQRWQRANRWLGWLGWQEARLVEFVQGVYRAEPVVQTPDLPAGERIGLPARMAGQPFRLLARWLVFIHQRLK